MEKLLALMKISLLPGITIEAKRESLYPAALHLRREERKCGIVVVKGLLSLISEREDMAANSCLWHLEHAIYA